MPNANLVTVTLPNDLLRDIDRREKNRSKFVAERLCRQVVYGLPAAVTWIRRQIKQNAVADASWQERS